MIIIQFHKVAKKVGLIFIVLLYLLILNSVGESINTVQASPEIISEEGVEIKAIINPLKCIAFSPYINGYDPNYPNLSEKVPPLSMIEKLLDIIVQQTDYNCIMTYGVHEPLDHIFQAAESRGLKVFTIIWLEAGNPVWNTKAIQDGIAAAKAFPETIIRISCGSELRSRFGKAVADALITKCIDDLKAADVTQPVSTNDTWWSWCSENDSCNTSWSSINVDWIGVNVYPWWDSKYSNRCILATEAATYTMNRVQQVKTRYPAKEVILTEFGWPAGPPGYREMNILGQSCDLASQANQELVVSATLAASNSAGIQSIAFEAFRESWKVSEGSVGPFWGIIIPTFTDVDFVHPYYDDIEILYTNGLTAGCVTSPLKFCPDEVMNRAQSAVFMLRGNFGSSYLPPASTHVFQDNWSPGLWAEKWADAMYTTSLSAGCATTPQRLFCPWERMPREQAVIFGLRLKYGNNYQPPPATGTLFADMTDTGYYATKWAEQAYIDGLIPACGTSGGKPKFCPQELVSRGLGAYMIVRAKSLTMP